MIRSVILIVLSLGLSPVIQGGTADSTRVEHVLSGRAFAVGFKDVGHIMTSPVRWGGKDWRNAAIASGAVIGTAFLLDKPVRDFSQRNRSRFGNNLARDFKPFGSYYPFIIESAFLLEGELCNDPRARACGLDAVSAGIISVGLIDQPLKYLIGRRRPFQEHGRFKLDPFTFDASFPSGHTTHAFMLATVISMHYPKTWVKITSYSIATLVAYDRINDDVHFTSDVVTGAIIGTVVGRAVVLFNRRLRRP